jgi:hypothetical protein
MINKTIDLLRIIGSPFGVSGIERPIESDELYQYAFKNRLGLLYLSALKEQDKLDKLIQEYEMLDRRAYETRLTAARVAQVFDTAGIPYVLFKTLRSYPATPNDVDVIFLGPGKQFEDAKGTLRSAGYFQNSTAAPLQNLFLDPRGGDGVSWDKKGGMYYGTV